MKPETHLHLRRIEQHPRDEGDSPSAGLSGTEALPPEHMTSDGHAKLAPEPPRSLRMAHEESQVLGLGRKGKAVFGRAVRERQFAGTTVMPDGFSRDQLKKLVRDVDVKHVQTREFDGKRLSYIEGWYAIAQANAIFGHAGWDREMVHFERVMERTRSDSIVTCGYMARVRIRVRAGSTEVIREGTGWGSAAASTATAANERALKAAETDATKRALSTFGASFGLNLYDKDHVPLKPRPVFALFAPDGRPLDDTLSPEAFSTGLRQLIEVCKDTHQIDQLSRHNRASLADLRIQVPTLRNAQGVHFADLLLRLMQRRREKVSAFRDASTHPAPEAETSAGVDEAGAASGMRTSSSIGNGLNAGPSESSGTNIAYSEASPETTTEMSSRAGETASATDAAAADNSGRPDAPNEGAGTVIGLVETSLEAAAATLDGNGQPNGGSNDAGDSSGRQSSAGEAEGNLAGNGRGANEARIEGDRGAIPASLSDGDAGDADGADTMHDDGLPRRRSDSPSVRTTLGPGEVFRHYTGQSSRRGTPHPFPSRSEVPLSKPAVASSIALTSAVATSEGKSASRGSAATTSDRPSEVSPPAFLSAPAQIEAKNDSPENVKPALGNPASTLSDVTDTRSAPDPSPTPHSKIALGLKIDKSKLWLGLEPRIRDKAHLRRVAELPCLICNRQPSHAHHLRFAQRRGLSQKVSDEYVVPLCALHHGDLHQSSSEQGWWKRQKIDPIAISAELWTKSLSLGRSHSR